MFFTEKNRKKNLIIFFLALPFFCGAIFLLQTHGVNAQDENAAMSGFSATAVGETTRDTGGGGSLIGNALDLVFKGLLLGIFTMIGWLASAAIILFEWVIKPENYSGPTGVLNQSVVYEMWKFIRDFFNLFFILVLLYIAFMVVFQIEKNFKKTLLSLVLAALFINFSYPVSRALIDVTNVPMYFFANQMASTNGGGTDVFGQAMSAAKIKNILIPGSGDGESRILQNSYSRYLIAIIFIFLFSITLLVLAVMFVVRLVALVILVIFSSVGFAASIVPGLSSYSKMWWENFWKYTFFGPAAMLMLLVSVRFFSALGDEKTGIFKNLIDTSAEKVVDSPTFFASMALFSVPIIMLWMAMAVAQKFSIAGASSVVGMGQKFSKWAGKAALSPVPWAGRKIESKLAGTKYGKYLAPHAVMKAFKQRSEEQKHSDEQPINLAASTMQDQLNGAISRVKSTLVPANYLPRNWDRLGANTDHTDHRFAERQKQKSEGVKEMTEVSDRSDVIMGHLENAIAGGDSAEAESAIGILVKNNDLNDTIVRLGTKYGGKNEVSSENAKIVLTNMLRQSGVTNDEDLAKSLMVLSDQALASGNYAFGGMSNYDPATHTFNVSTARQQADQVAGKFNNLEPQKQAQMLHPDALFKRDATGFTDMNDDVAVAVIGNITKATADQSNRSRSDMRSALQNAWEQAHLPGGAARVPKFIANYNGNSNFRYYVGKMLDQNGALPAGVTASTMPATI